MKINVRQYREFMDAFYHGGMDFERAGEFFCSRFGVTDADLFYAKDGDAFRQIANRYVDWQALGE